MKRIFIWFVLYTTNSLQPMPPVGTSSTLPNGTSTSPKWVSLSLGFGLYLPIACVLWKPDGRLAALRSGPWSGRIFPRATSQRTKVAIPPEISGLQYGNDFPIKSAKYTPLPKRKPELGASGGAILIPWERMPTKFENRLPCQRSFLLCNFFGL